MSTIKNFRIGDRVSIEGKATGEIVGGPIAFRARPGRGAHEGFLVALDEGFYSQDRKHFVSVLVVHPENLRPE
jgi:hypothetical protein